MSWTSLDEYEGTSTSDEEDIGNNLNVDGSQVNRIGKMGRRFGESEYLEVKQISPCNPYIQEPNSDNEINSRMETRTNHQDLRNLIAAKDERIRVLQKLVNGQREQLYHFLNMSLKEETLLELKKTCRETEALNQNENMAMALDKFKYENHLPTEQTLVRKDVSKTLFKIERLMRHQMKLVKTMESGGNEEEQLREDGDKSVDTLSCFRTDDQLTEVQKLFRSTKNVQRKLNLLKIQLKKLALIEEERIDLVERVYSMPPDQRQYYAQLAVIEREKIQLISEIDKLNESYRDLKQKCSLLEETENELNRSLDTKLAGIDFAKVKPGLERHIELMDVLERGQMSMIKSEKNKNGKLSEDFIKFCNEKAEMSMRLKDFDEVTKERDQYKEQIEILVENSLRLQSELKDLRIASSSSKNRNEDLIKELRQVSIEREELRAKLQGLSKKEGSSSGRMKIHDEVLERMIKERDQLVAEYRTEIERLKNNLTLLEDEVKSGKLALLDKTEKNLNRNVSKEFEMLRELEEQKERLVVQISRYKYALLRQESEVRDLVNIIEKLTEKLPAVHKRNSAINPAEEIPENSEIEAPLTYEEQKRLDTIRRRIKGPENSAATSAEKRDEVVPTENNQKAEKNHNTIINSIKSFLGLDDRIFKT